MNSRILFLSIALALPLSAGADEAVETRAELAPRDGSGLRLERPSRFARLEQLREAGRAEIQNLNEQLRNAQSDEQRDALQMQIVNAKRAHRERFLEERMALAEQQGDMIQADQARRQLENLRNQNDQRQLNVARPAPSQEDNR